VLATLTAGGSVVWATETTDAPDLYETHFSTEEIGHQW
jgi:hypothetical protein